MSTNTASRTPFVLPADPFERFAILQSMVGSFVHLSSGDFTIEGTLVAVIRPVRGSDSENPIVVLSVQGERIIGPVLPSDLVS